jgi:hypothetical protein
MNSPVTPSEIGLWLLAVLVIGITIGFRWSDKLWREHREQADAEDRS